MARRTRTRSVRDKTGSFYKVREWNETNVTWMQKPQTYDDLESAQAAAEHHAKKGGRWQAIHLEGKRVKDMKITVVYDSHPED